MPATALDDSTQIAVREVTDELVRARAKHKNMNSLHEAYAVILEEVEEFWDEVKLKASERTPEQISSELTQIAAMALRAKLDLGFYGDFDV